MDAKHVDTTPSWIGPRQCPQRASAAIKRVRSLHSIIESESFLLILCLGHLLLQAILLDSMGVRPCRFGLLPAYYLDRMNGH